jgi:integrase/recombinase XerD
MPAKEGVELAEFRHHLESELHLAANSVKTYCQHIVQYLAFIGIRGCAPAAAAREEVLAYLDDYHKRGHRSASLFGATIALRRYYQFLVSAGVVPCDLTVGIRLPKITSRKPEPLTEPETGRLFSLPAIKFHDIRDHALLELLYSGLRITEALAITPQDINAQDGYVKVRSGKGGRDRLVPVGNKAIEALGRYINAKAARYLSPLPSLFVSYRGKPLTRTAFWLRLKIIARRMGIGKRLYPHLLRHGFATDMLNRGCDLKVLQEMLGHQNLSTTSIYLHPTAQHLIQAHRRAHPRT